MTKRDIHLDVRSSPRLLKAIRGLVRGYAESFGLPPERAGEVVLAVDEACANAIRHAYHFDQDGRITLCFSVHEGWMEIVLRDQGETARPEQVQRKDGPAPDKGAAKPGGLGVQLMYRVFDDVQFSPGETCGNCVVMRLKLPGKARVQST